MALPTRCSYLALAVVLLAATSCRDGQPRAESTQPITLVDHHVHLLSDSLIADWKSLGVPFSRPDSAYSDPRVALEDLRSMGAYQGKVPGDPGVVLVPMAHLYGNADFRNALGLDGPREEAAVKRENDHVMRQAAEYSDDATALCGVDVLRPYALREIARCLGQPYSAGLKLHLASAGVDLSSSDHRARVSAALEAAHGLGLSVWLHLDTQSGDLDIQDVVSFAQEVFGPLPELNVVLAHMGGSGGYGAWTRQVFTSLSEWLEQEEADGRPRAGYRFDISAVWLTEPSEGVPASTSDEAQAWRADLERFGTERLLFGTDYPVFLASSYWEAIAGPAVLGDELAGEIAGNRVRVSTGTRSERSGAR